MTVYVHIGTMKTGTSSIQNFLYMNRDLLQEQNYYYPISIKNKNRLNDHNPFAHRFNAMLNKTNDLKLLYKEFNYLNNEVEKCNCGNIVISAENTQWLLDSQQKIEYFYNFLSLKFHNIKIVIYLRDVVELFISMCSQAIKGNSHTDYHCLLPYQNQKSKILSNYQQMLQWWGGIFGKENLIVRLFDKNEFKDGDLLKDFVDAIGIEWDDSFKIPKKDNETLDLIGFELLCRVNKLKPFMFVSRYFDIVEYFDRNCTSGNKNPHLKFQPPKEIIQSYIDYFEESNEWVRKEFFPHKERLFPKKDLSNYRENYELKEMKPEYWDKIAELIVDIVKTKNQAIVDKITIIQNKDKLIVQKNQQIQQKDQIIQTKNQLDTTQKELDSKVKQMDSQIKNLESSQNQSNLKIQKLTEANQQLTQTNNQLNSKTKELNFTLHYGTAKSRIHNHLSYKLGQAMIENSKSLLGYIRMPYVLSYIKDKHKQEQQQYQEAIKKNPNLKLPNLESYPDYQESLKEKECLTYKLGEAFIKASKTWYKGGYIALMFEVGRLNRELAKKRKLKKKEERK